MTDFAGLIGALSRHEVEFIVVGGAAATAHGSARLTAAIDIVYRRTEDNIRRLADALAAHKPYPRGAPSGLPFQWDRDTIERGLNFTLTTQLGDIDLLGEITGGGGYADLLPHSVPLRVFGMDCHCLGLKRLIEVKRAVGRPKDYESIAELEAMLDERGE